SGFSDPRRGDLQAHSQRRLGTVGTARSRGGLHSRARRYSPLEHQLDSARPIMSTLRRRAGISLVLLSLLACTACQQAKQISDLAPVLLSPGRNHLGIGPLESSSVAGVTDRPEQSNPGFEITWAGTDGQGRDLYHVRIGPL